MNLRNELERIATRTPDVGDLADRAIALHERRRRTRIPVAIAAAGIAVAVGVTAVGTRPWASDEPEPAKDTITIGGFVELPTKAAPLPAKGVGPVLLAYQWNCAPDADTSKYCVQSRVMTLDGRHWEVKDATPMRSPNNGVPGVEAISVSPDGSQLAYTHGNELVLRDLATGAVRPSLDLGPTLINVEIRWSPDSRRLSVCQHLFSAERRSALVDARSARATALAGDGCTLGLPAGSGLIPFNTDPKGDSSLALLDSGGEVRGHISTLPLGVRDPDGMLGLISPDGKAPTTVTFPTEAYKSPILQVFATDPVRRLERVQVDKLWSDWDTPVLLGWTDASTVLIKTTRLVPVDEDELRTEAYNVDAFDTRTGALRRIFGFPNTLASVSVATDQL